MHGKKIIAVAGATGAQGGGLVEAILADPAGGFQARALTRDPKSEKARALAARGAEVVAADVNDAASLEAAFRGAHGAYCVTFFWDHFSPVKEVEQAAAMAKAAKAAGVGHVVWSTLEDTRRWVPLLDNRMPTLMGSYKVPHFDAKGESDHLFLESGVPATCLLTSFYWDNLIHFGMGLRRTPEGGLVFSLPMGEKKLPGIAAADIGACAFGIFRRGPEFHGKTVGIAGEHPTGAQMAAGLSRVLGERVEYQAVPFDVYRGLGFPGAEDLGNMFQFKHDFNEYFCGARSVEFSRGLHPGLRSFDGWVKDNGKRIPIV
jgi:uncharacterized protein YbjT (DUF2867 family)